MPDEIVLKLHYLHKISTTCMQLAAYKDQLVKLGYSAKPINGGEEIWGHFFVILTFACASLICWWNEHFWYRDIGGHNFRLHGEKNKNSQSTVVTVLANSKKKSQLHVHPNVLFPERLLNWSALQSISILSEKREGSTVI